MNTIRKNYITTKQGQIFTILVLTGILSVGSGLTLLKSATANPTDLFPTNKNELLEENLTTKALPHQVADAVLQAIARGEQMPTRQLEITDYHQQTWRDGCLELPNADEFCTQALVPGWRVMVSNDSQHWIYHSNSNGRSLRLANSDTLTSNPLKNLPVSVKDAVLQAASQRLNLPTDRLTIIQAQQQTWRNGCLELSKPDEVCAQALVAGWRVVVGAVDQTLVYHTNDSGSVARLNEKASQISENNLPAKVDESGRVALDERASTIAEHNAIKPVPIPTSELPPALQKGVIFRQITSGGFAGRTYETVLLDDGRLIRVRVGDANDSQRSIRRIYRSQVRQFQKLLEQERFSEFKNQKYPASGGAADYRTYTLTNRDGTVEYNDISQSSLPENLRIVIKAWNRINR